MSNKRDYYEVLGISRNTKKDDIKNAYRNLALKYHPDRNKSHDAEEKFKEISEAYAVLSDNEKRNQYDAYGHDGVSTRYRPEDIYRGADFEDIFSDLGFGGFNNIFDLFFSGGRQRSRATVDEEYSVRGSDLLYQLEITLEQAVAGLKTEIEFLRIQQCETCKGTRAKPGTTTKTCQKCQGSGKLQITRSSGFARYVQVTQCNRCNGTGKIIETPCSPCRGAGVTRRKRKLSVAIPAGVDTGYRLRLRGEGEQSIKGLSGDLYISIRVKPHKMFARHQNHLVCEIPIKFTWATLGAEIEIPTIDGKAKLKISPGTQNDTILRLRGKGIPNPHGLGKGDQLVRIKVETPTNLTSQQKNILLEFSKKRGEDPPLKKKKWF